MNKQTWWQKVLEVIGVVIMCIGFILLIMFTMWWDKVRFIHAW